MASAVVGSKIYFFGGMTDWLNFFGSTNSYSYDTATDEWKQLTNFSRSIYGACAATDGNDKIYVFGKIICKLNDLVL